MKSKTPLAIAATLAVAIAAAYISHIRAPETDVGTPPLFPDLQSHINDVKLVEIHSRALDTVLVGDASGWKIENRDNYPAKFEDIKRTVVALGELKTIEAKTKEPELYPQIGVEDVSAEDSKSTQLTLKDAAGKAIADLIIGKERASTSGPIKAARYVRKAGDPQSWLVEGELNLPIDTLGWTDRQLLSVASNRIREIVIDTPGKARVQASRQRPTDSELGLDQIPTGYKLRSASIVTSLGTVLEELRFDDVRAVSSLQWPTDSTVTTLRGFDGLVATINTATIDNKKYSRIAFSFDQGRRIAGSREYSKAGGDLELPVPGSENKDKKTEKPATPSVADEMKALNARVDGWAFVLPDYKQSMLTRTMDDLIAKQELMKPKTPPVPPPDPLTVEHFDKNGKPIPVSPGEAMPMPMPSPNADAMPPEAMPPDAAPSATEQPDAAPPSESPSASAQPETPPPVAPTDAAPPTPPAPQP
ncbi:MAG: DUF4340 domain-containing protein [Gammaproteobacteria bacterium]